ncbi:MAG: hypothetical protein IKU40_12145, partial [Clostridia bacterium]|nr:hypothetical protein [Clostridia bacterium]
MDRSTPVNWDSLYVSAQSHQKIPFSQTHISPTNRLQQIEVFAELFSKSDRLPFPQPPHIQNFVRKKAGLHEEVQLERLFFSILSTEFDTADLAA